MWYLITFEDTHFVRIKNKQNPTDYKFDGLEDGNPEYNVLDGGMSFELEVEDNGGDTADYLSDLHALGNGYFILLNHATVLLRWDGGIESLNRSVSGIFETKDRYAIIPVDRVAGSNFIQIETLNGLLK
jgi:hypothetical protein